MSRAFFKRPAVAFDGKRLLMVWPESRSILCEEPLLCPYPPDEAYAIRLDADGDTFDRKPLRLPDEAVNPVSVASSGTEFLVLPDETARPLVIEVEVVPQGWAGHEVTPLAVQIDEREVDEAVDDEQPHRREMPVARAGEPSAEGHPRGYRIAFEGIAAERLALSREPGVGVEDLKSAAGHEHDREHVHPVGDAHDPVMAEPSRRGARVFHQRLWRVISRTAWSAARAVSAMYVIDGFWQAELVMHAPSVT